MMSDEDLLITKQLDVLWALADAIMLDQCEVQITGPKK